MNSKQTGVLLTLRVRLWRFVGLTRSVRSTTAVADLSLLNRLVLAMAGISLLLSSSGCEPAGPTQVQPPAVKAPPPPPPPAESTPSTPVQAAPARQEPFAATPFTGTPLPATPIAQAPSQSQPAPSANSNPNPENAGSKKAQVGVGKKTSRLSKSLIGYEFAALYCVRERMVFDVQIPEAMKLFKATEDRNPRSQEEFMEKIIKANNIHLPELSEGETYRYDPKTGELWVDPPPEK